MKLFGFEGSYSSYLVCAASQEEAIGVFEKESGDTADGYRVFEVSMDKPRIVISEHDGCGIQEVK